MLPNVICCYGVPASLVTTSNQIGDKTTIRNHLNNTHELVHFTIGLKFGTLCNNTSPFHTCTEMTGNEEREMRNDKVPKAVVLGMSPGTSKYYSNKTVIL